MVGYKREEEKIRTDGISSEIKIKDFSYLKCNFSDELIDKFKRMQDKYKVDMNKIIYNKITNKLLGINIVIIKIYENIKTDSDKEK